MRIRKEDVESIKNSEDVRARGAIEMGIQEQRKDIGGSSLQSENAQMKLALILIAQGHSSPRSTAGTALKLIEKS